MRRALLPVRRDDGMATAELAVALPAVAVVLGLILGALDYGITQVRSVEASRVVARMVARGDSVASARRVGLQGLPGGASVDVSGGEDEVVVQVTAPSRAVSLLGLPPVRARAVAPAESEGTGP